MSMKSMEPFTTFRHFRRKSGAVTAACVICPGSKKMLVGLAFCSPHEKVFNRIAGRTHAKERFFEANVVLSAEDGISKNIITFLKSLTPETIPGVKQYGDGRDTKKEGEFKIWFPTFQAEL